MANKWQTEMDLNVGDLGRHMNLRHMNFEFYEGRRIQIEGLAGHKPSGAQSLEVHLAPRQAYQGASFSSSITTHSKA